MQGPSFLGPLEVIWEEVEKTSSSGHGAAGTCFYLHGQVLESGSTGEANGEKHPIKNSRSVRSIRGGLSNRGTSQARDEPKTRGATVRNPEETALCS